jgi:hypothetical protein
VGDARQTGWPAEEVVAQQVVGKSDWPAEGIQRPLDEVAEQAVEVADLQVPQVAAVPKVGRITPGLLAVVSSLG